MKFPVYILILLSFSFSSCLRNTDTRVEVQDVNLEEVVSDSSEFIEPPPPPSAIGYSKDLVLRLNYNAIECTCAQWSESKYNDDPDKRELIFLERASNDLIKADSLWIGDNLPLVIEVTGQFKKRKGFPNDYNPAKGNPKPARIFRYSKIRIIRNGE